MATKFLNNDIDTKTDTDEFPYNNSTESTILDKDNHLIGTIGPVFECFSIMHLMMSGH